MNKITLVIIIITVLFSMKGFKDSTWFNKYKFQIGPISRKEYIRLLSSGFLHVDFTHLLFNMLTLYFFADVLIVNLGNSGFIAIYVGSLLVGNILTLLYHKNEMHYSAVGASGAVSGVLFSAILLFPKMSLYLMFIPVPIPAYIVGIAYLAYTVFGMKKQHGNIGHSAHLGGAVAGILLTLLLNPSLIETRSLTLLLLGIPIVLFFIIGNKMK